MEEETSAEENCGTDRRGNDDDEEYSVRSWGWAIVTGVVFAGLTVTQILVRKLIN
jgi:hypothetical protein